MSEILREEKITEIKQKIEETKKFREAFGMKNGDEMLEAMEYLLSELTEEKRHAETEREQANKWLEENSRLRAELDAQESWKAISEMAQRESTVLRAELEAKDKVLEWIRDAGTDYQSIHKAREVLYQYKGDTSNET